MPQEQPKPSNDGTIDIEQDNSTTELGDFDYDRLSYIKGLPLEKEQTDSRTTVRSAEDEQIVQPKVVAAPTPQAIVPRGCGLTTRATSKVGVDGWSRSLTETASTANASSRMP